MEESQALVKDWLIRKRMAGKAGEGGQNECGL